MTVKELTDQERAAILRSCRDTMSNMERELEVIQGRIDLGHKAAEVEKEILQFELDLITSGVRKLWATYRSKPP